MLHTHVAKCFIWMLRMFAMVLKCFSSAFVSVSNACFKCFICLQMYVVGAVSRCFKKKIRMLYTGYAWKAGGGASGPAQNTGVDEEECWHRHGVQVRTGNEPTWATNRPTDGYPIGRQQI
jgi:hypothetical protein